MFELLSRHNLNLWESINREFWKLCSIIRDTYYYLFHNFYQQNNSSLKKKTKVLVHVFIILKQIKTIPNRLSKQVYQFIVFSLQEYNVRYLNHSDSIEISIEHFTTQIQSKII